MRQFCVVKSIAYLGLAAALWAACSPSAPEEQTQKTETPLDSVSVYLESNPNDLDALAFRSGLYLEQKNLPYAKADMEAALAKDFSAAALDGIAVKSRGLNSDMHASAEYRAHLITVMAKRAIKAAK